MKTRGALLVAAVACVALALGGCGSTGPSGFQRKVAVIRAWSAALRRGDVTAAAAYFALPSVFVNGTPPLTVRTAGEARAVNEALPCGARLVSATRHGRYVDAGFVLTGRPGPGGSECGGGAGQTAHTLFLIERGRIVAWLRAPAGGGAPSAPGSPGQPPASTGSGSSVSV